MVAPLYATDLQNISLAQVTTGWTNIGTGAPVAETDYFINGAACIAKGGWQSAVRGNIFDFGSNIPIASPNAVFIWETYWFPNLMDSEAAGGQRVLIGSAVGAYRNWYVRGADTHQYGGWIPQVVDPNVGGDSDVGAPGTGAFRFFGGSCSIIAAGGTPKGNPFGIGVVRYGREFHNTLGEVADPATFAGGAVFSNEINRRWGQLFLKDGAYFMQGAFVMGLAGTAVYFADQNKSIFILNTKKVSAGFNEFVVRHASSTVNWTSITVTALGTVSRGKFTVEANATVTLTTCVFTDMDTFTFMSNTSALGCTFRRCNAITANGAVLNGSTVAASTVAADESALLWNVADGDPNGNLDDMTFTKGANDHHAISLAPNAAITNVTLRGITFTGFSTAAETAATADNHAVLELEDRGADTTWNINKVNCSGILSYKTRRVTDTVNIIADPVTLDVTVVDLLTGDPIQGVNVLVEAAAGGSMTPGDDIIKALTDVNGEVSDTRTYASPQPITGRARLAPLGGPYYKTGSIAGIISNTAGLSLTIQMILDT